jgi:hypothetical protein
VLILTAAVSPLHCICIYFLTKSMQYKRVAQFYKTGVYIAIGNFSGKWCNKWVEQYNTNFNKKNNSWWRDLLVHYDVTKVGQVDTSILDEGWAALQPSYP